MEYTITRFPSWIHVLLIGAALIGVRITYYSLSDGFTLQKIENTFPKERFAKSVTKKELQTLNQVCSQPYRYLAKGSQAYAFISADGKYVLKLFKCYHLKPLPWLQALPLPGPLAAIRDERLQHRTRKIEKTMQSYELAYHLLQDECGLLYLQVVPNPELNQTLTIYDKLGRRYTIRLADFGFMIQKKADLIFPTMKQWIEQHDLHTAKAFLHSLVELIVLRSKKGVQDSDPDLHKNAGVFENRAIFIDVGSFHTSPDAKKSHIFTNDLVKITKKLKVWLKEQDPVLAQFLEEEINTYSH